LVNQIVHNSGVSLPGRISGDLTYHDLRFLYPGSNRNSVKGCILKTTAAAALAGYCCRAKSAKYRI